MAIQWKEPKTQDRLLAAVIAASENLNMKEVARVFGQGATYDAVEGQLRKAKQAARTLRTEAEGRSGPAKATSRVTKKDKVAAGPVKFPVKGARVTNSKKTSAVKDEPVEDDVEEIDEV